MMTNSDHEGQIFLSHPHLNNGFFFLLTIKYCVLKHKKTPRSSEVPEYAEMQQDLMMSLKHNNEVT